MLQDCECVECCNRSSVINGDSVSDNVIFGDDVDDDNYDNFAKKDLQFVILKICQKFFETIQEEKYKFEIELIDIPMKHGDINGTKDIPTSIFLDKSICVIQEDSFSEGMKQSISHLEFILNRNEIKKQTMKFLDICYEWYVP